ncbi:hypothetical protein [Parapedobacter defluvii]|mgnify:CR=1 FL=1|nr:hypothetical protein [Parapedobacter defluvii]RQP16721.1 MAG: hypothetical protein EAS52_10970 [Parapedobacter sp.]
MVMSTQVTRKIFAKLFFAIFFAKMFISTAPIFIQQFDRDTLLQVVMQLEIENNTGKSGIGDQVKDTFAKDYAKSAIHFTLQPPTDFFIRTNFISDDARHICAFYPSVPTPPPNC